MNALDDNAGSPPTTAGRAKWPVILAFVLILAGALGFALTRDGRPSGTETGEVNAAAAGSLAGLEARVDANPEDVTGWEQLGQQRYDTADYGGAVQAYRRATVLAPAVAAYWSALGDSLVMAAPRGGPPVPDDAVAAFRRAIAIDAGDPRARYFLAARKDQDGDHEGAIADWLALLADTPPASPLEQDLRYTIERVGAREGIAVASRIAAVRQPGVSPAN